MTFETPSKHIDYRSPDDIRHASRIIAGKSMLKNIYEEWYDKIVRTLPGGSGRILELGSGGGFLRSRIPDLITSDILPAGGIDVVIDGVSLPVRTGRVRAIVMLNVFHHLSDPDAFLAEASQCLTDGGKIIMIEPWVSPWSRFVYRFHHEYFNPSAPSLLQADGTTNNALPWLVFHRHRDHFAKAHPSLALSLLEPCTPFRYVLSGGVSRPAFVPSWTDRLFTRVERGMAPLMNFFAMFACIVVSKKGK